MKKKYIYWGLGLAAAAAIGYWLWKREHESISGIGGKASDPRYDCWYDSTGRYCCMNKKTGQVTCINSGKTMGASSSAAGREDRVIPEKPDTPCGGGWFFNKSIWKWCCKMPNGTIMCAK